VDGVRARVGGAKKGSFFSVSRGILVERQRGGGEAEERDRAGLVTCFTAFAPAVPAVVLSSIESTPLPPVDAADSFTRVNRASAPFRMFLRYRVGAGVGRGLAITIFSAARRQGNGDGERREDTGEGLHGVSGKMRVIAAVAASPAIRC